MWYKGCGNRSTTIKVALQTASCITLIALLSISFPHTHINTYYICTYYMHIYIYIYIY